MTERSPLERIAAVVIAAAAVIGLLVGLGTFHDARPVDEESQAPAAGRPVRDPDVLLLVQRVRERLELMTDVARAKWNTGRSINDPDREAALLERVSEKAREHGLDVAAAETFFRAQLEASRHIQERKFAEWEIAQQPKFDDAPDLARDLRPKIDEATNALFDAYLPIALRPRTQTLADAFGRAAESENSNRDIPESAMFIALSPFILLLN